ncbi:MAG: hypothetical protein ACK4NR_09300 [Micavibrio sp.]
MQKTQFETVLEKFPGGVSEIAAILGVTENAVYRWGYPKGKTGTGGIVPSKYHESLLKAAAERRYKLKPKDFFAHLSGATVGSAQ